MITFTSCDTLQNRNADDAVIFDLLRVFQSENFVNQYMSVDIDADKFNVEHCEREHCERKHLTHCIVKHEFALHQVISIQNEVNSSKNREFF